jgi:large subunit ribosomal protein L25
MDQELKISVPVVARGHAPGVEKEGGVLEQLVRELEVICLPSKIPASIVVDVSSLALGQAVHIREMVLPEGVRTSAEPGLVVFHVARPQEEVVVAPAEEGPTEPELIRPPGRGEEEAAEGEVKEEKKKEEKK